MRRITIRHQRLGECGRVRFYDRCKSPAVGIEPCADSTCPFHRIETAGFTQDCGRKTRVQGVEPVQQAPCRCFADREIGIVPGLFAARGRQRHAGHKPHGNQVEEDIYFLRLKREFLMKTGSKGASRANRIIHIENGIGAGNCNLCNQHRMDSIPEIDQPGNALAVIVIHQHIPVIGIIVDHLRARKRKLRSDIALETRKEVLDHRAVFRLVDEMQALTRPACMAQIPIEIPQRTRMYEALQGTIEFAQCTAQIFEKRFRALPFRKRVPGSQLAMRSACGLPSGPCAEARTSPERLGLRCGTAAAGFVSTRCCRSAVWNSLSTRGSLAFTIFNIQSAEPAEPLTEPLATLRRKLQSRSLSSGEALALTPKWHSASRSASFVVNSGAGCERSVMENASSTGCKEAWGAD